MCSPQAGRLVLTGPAGLLLFKPGCGVGHTPGKKALAGSDDAELGLRLSGDGAAPLLPCTCLGWTLPTLSCHVEGQGRQMRCQRGRWGHSGGQARS